MPHTQRKGKNGARQVGQTHLICPKNWGVMTWGRKMCSANVGSTSAGSDFLGATLARLKLGFKWETDIKPTVLGK